MAEFTAVFLREEDGSVDINEFGSVDIKSEGDGPLEIKEEDGALEIKEEDGSLEIKECVQKKDPLSTTSTSQSTKSKSKIMAPS